MTKTTINFESDAFTDVDDTSLQALADKCKTLEKVENMEEPETAPVSLMAKPPPPDQPSLMSRQV